MFRCVFALFVLFSAVLLASPSPAAAHTGESVVPSNYRTDIKNFTPSVPGVSLSAIELGEKLQLKNTTDVDVIVDGYEGESYLRVGRDGEFVNTRSPAYYVNETSDGTTAAPEFADAKAAPEWKKLSSSDTTVWHDHRAHWMGTTDPASVRAEPGRTREVMPDWVVTMHHGDTTLTATGDVVYVPPVSPWPWVALMAVVAAATGGAVWFSKSRWTSIASIFVVSAAYAIHFVGKSMLLGATLDEAVTIVVAALMAGLSFYLLWRRSESAVWVCLFTTALVTFLGGLSDLGFVRNSQLTTALPTGLARTIVSLLFGAGVGATVAFGLSLRNQRRVVDVEVTNGVL